MQILREAHKYLETPLPQLALQHNLPDAVPVLEQGGVDLTAVDQYGLSVLYCAVTVWPLCSPNENQMMNDCHPKKVGNRVTPE